YTVLATLMTLSGKVERHRWFLWGSVLMIPVPFLSGEAGWLVAEVGRQPWTVYEILPTWLSVSTHSETYMIFSLTGFILLYTIFAIVELFLMLHFIRKGPGDHTAPAAPEPSGRLAAAT
ncbi:MAG: cytochrome ubiquinol oxidase subunit I, partial [Hyphomicrobium sp.]|nr:cytochrome ubiquinol oxidase subunit I [Hyphomicrobium sp.]